MLILKLGCNEWHGSQHRCVDISAVGSLDSLGVYLPRSWIISYSNFIILRTPILISTVAMESTN